MATVTGRTHVAALWQKPQIFFVGNRSFQWPTLLVISKQLFSQIGVFLHINYSYNDVRIVYPLGYICSATSRPKKLNIFCWHLNIKLQNMSQYNFFLQEKMTS